MLAGHLRDRIVIEQLSTAKDAYGATSQSWSPFATCWAKMETLSGRELIAAQAAQSEVSYRVTLRYQKALGALGAAAAKLRIRHDGKTFSVHAVRDVDGFKREMEIDCAQGLNQG